MAQVVNRMTELAYGNVSNEKAKLNYPLFGNELKNNNTKFVSVTLRDGFTMSVKHSDK